MRSSPHIKTHLKNKNNVRCRKCAHTHTNTHGLFMFHSNSRAGTKLREVLTNAFLLLLLGQTQTGLFLRVQEEDGPLGKVRHTNTRLHTFLARLNHTSATLNVCHYHRRVNTHSNVSPKSALPLDRPSSYITQDLRRTSCICECVRKN